MPEKPKLPSIMGHDRFAEMAGIEVLVAAPGYAETRMPVTPGILNGHGNVHGGAIFTLADYTSAVASNVLGFPTIATDGHVSFLRSVTEGHLLAKAKTVKTGRRLNFQSVEIFNAAGELVALFQGTAIRVDAKRRPPDR